MLTLNGNKIFLLDDSKLAIEPAYSAITSAIYGEGDDIQTDLIVKGSGTPMLYDVAGSATMQSLFPFSTVSSHILSIIPSVGQSIFGMSLSTGLGTGTDVTAIWLSTNEDQFTLTNCAVTKPPDLNLGTNKPIFGPIEISGIISTAAGAGGFFDPSQSGAYYTTATSQIYTGTAMDSTSLGRGSYTAAWNGKTFTSFQTQDGFQVTHEMKLESRQAYGGLTCDMILSSYRVMCKCIPVGPAATMLNIQNAQGAGGNTGFMQGRRMGLQAANLALSCTSAEHSPTITLTNAVQRTAGFVFGNKPLRNGEIGFVSTWGTGGPGNTPSGTPPTAIMTLA